MKQKVACSHSSSTSVTPKVWAPPLPCPPPGHKKPLLPIWTKLRSGLGVLSECLGCLLDSLRSSWIICARCPRVAMIVGHDVTTVDNTRLRHGCLHRTMTMRSFVGACASAMTSQSFVVGWIQTESIVCAYGKYLPPSMFCFGLQVYSEFATVPEQHDGSGLHDGSGGHLPSGHGWTSCPQEAFPRCLPGTLETRLKTTTTPPNFLPSECTAFTLLPWRRSFI